MPVDDEGNETNFIYKNGEIMLNTDLNTNFFVACISIKNALNEK